MAPNGQSPHLPQPAPIAAASGAPLRPLGPWSTTGWALLAMLAWVAAQVVVLLVFAVRWVALNPGATIDPDRIAYDAHLMALAVILSTAAECAVVALAVRRARWPVAEYLGLVRRPHAREIVFCLACLAVILPATDLLSWLTGRELLPSFMVKVYQAAREAGGTAIALVIFAAVVAAPIGEEIMFRGFLFRGWSASRLGGTGTIVLTSAIWAGIHVQYDLFGIMQVFGLGLLMGWVRWRSGSALLTMLMHATVNLAATVETAIILEWFA
jgi:membrane protease YdiL (CAAX protease family)